MIFHINKYLNILFISIGFIILKVYEG
jgi:hypothetical protein